MSEKKNLRQSEVRNSLEAVMDELKKDAEVMDTRLIDAALADEPGPEPEKVLQVYKQIEAEYARDERKARHVRLAKRVSAVAACLVIGLFGVFGAAQALHWEAFIRLIQNLSEVLSLNVKQPEYPAEGQIIAGKVEEGETMRNSSQEPLQVLEDLPEPWRTGMLRLNDRWPVRSVNVYSDEEINIYGLVFQDREDREIFANLEICKDGNNQGNMRSETSEDEREIIVIDNETVTIYNNIDYWGGYFSRDDSYIRIWKNNSKEETMSIFEILIGGLDSHEKKD